MNKFVIPLLVIIHLVYVSSHYVKVLPHNEFVSQIYIFAIYVCVYSISLFFNSIVKYVTLPFYILLAYRIFLGVYPSFAAGDYMFFSTTLVSMLLVLVIVYNILFKKACPVPSAKIDKFFLILWIMTTSFVAFFTAAFLAKDINIYTLMLSFLCVSAFVATPYIALRSGVMHFVLTLILCGFSIPYINVIFFYDGAMFVSLLTTTALCLIGATLVCLQARWITEKKFK